MPPLFYAITSQNSAELEHALQRNPDLGETEAEFGGTALHAACITGNNVLIDLLITKYMEESPQSFSERDLFGRTPLFLLARTGYLAGLGRALELAPKEALSCDEPAKRSPLHIAIAHQHSACAALLVEKGPKEILSLKDAYGRSPLHLAATMGNHQLAEQLLGRDEFSAEWLEKDVLGRTPLHCAACAESWSTVQLIMTHPAITSLGTQQIEKLFRADNEGCTWLHRLSLWADPEKIREAFHSGLVAKLPDQVKYSFFAPDIPLNNTPVHTALMRKRFPSALEILDLAQELDLPEEKMMQLLAPNRFGTVPLHRVLTKCGAEEIQAFLAHPVITQAPCSAELVAALHTLIDSALHHHPEGARKATESGGSIWAYVAASRDNEVLRSLLQSEFASGLKEALNEPGESGGPTPLQLFSEAQCKIIIREKSVPVEVRCNVIAHLLLRQGQLRVLRNMWTSWMSTPKAEIISQLCHKDPTFQEHWRSW